MKIILNLVAIVLYILVYVIDFIRVLIVNIKRRGYLRRIDEQNFTSAYEADVFGNYQYKETWNWMFAKKSIKVFGRFGETLSSSFGKGRKDETLNGFGIAISWLLDFLWFTDWFKGGHCKVSIMSDEKIYINVSKYIKRE